MKTGKLGVIGGVGPEATARFMELVIKNTDAATDQEHIPMAVFNDTRIPDRTAYILDNTKEDPLPYMLEDAIGLEKLGCTVIAIPCNTAHYFYDDIAAGVHIPVLNILEEAARYCASEPSVRKVGLMATDGTIKSGVYEKYLKECGLDLVLPDGHVQERIMSLIYEQVKAGKEPDLAMFYSILEHMAAKGCDRIILGCTELSVIHTMVPENNVLVDPMEVLARKAVIACGKELR